jgi:hypothetical protein
MLSFIGCLHPVICCLKQAEKNTFLIIPLHNIKGNDLGIRSYGCKFALDEQYNIKVKSNKEPAQ